MMDWHLFLEIIGPATIIFAGGRWVNRIDGAIERLEESHKLVSKIPFMHTRLRAVEREVGFGEDSCDDAADKGNQ